MTPHYAVELLVRRCELLTPAVMMYAETALMTTLYMVGLMPVSACLAACSVLNTGVATLTGCSVVIRAAFSKSWDQSAALVSCHRNRGHKGAHRALQGRAHRAHYRALIGPRGPILG